jgi:small conductance mechanosensitive channel
MGSLLKSIVTGVVLTVVTLMFIAELGYDIAPLIASAGIIGVAIGFGSQALVKDFLSGIFMIFEDQYGVGDEVDLGEAAGPVEAVSLRVTRLRDINGTVWYVRNGEILRVGNMSQNWARSVLDVKVAYGEDLARVPQVLAELARDIWEDDDYKGRVIEEPSVWGVQELGADAVVLRVALKTAPLAQWAVAREMRARIKARFDHEGFEVPFAQHVVWHRDEERPRTQVTDEDEQPPAQGPAQVEGGSVTT